VSHNPAQSCCDNIPFNLKTITITQILSIGGEETFKNKTRRIKLTMFSLFLIPIS